MNTSKLIGKTSRDQARIDNLVESEKRAVSAVQAAVTILQNIRKKTSIANRDLIDQWMEIYKPDRWR